MFVKTIKIKKKKMRNSDVLQIIDSKKKKKQKKNKGLRVNS